MSNGGWTIVLVIIVLGIVTGFLVSANMALNDQAVIREQALEISGAQYATAVALAGTEAAGRQTAVAMLQTATAAVDSCQTENKKLGENLEEAKTGQANAQATLQAMGQTQPRANRDGARSTVVSPFQATPQIPRTGEVRKAGLNLAWLPVGGALAIFSLVVVAAYRMLKIEDRAQGQTG